MIREFSHMSPTKNPAFETFLNYEMKAMIMPLHVHLDSSKNLSGEKKVYTKILNLDIKNGNLFTE